MPVVAIVGRPNVGKSALFNRLTRSQRAIVDATPGVTRDRNLATAEWRGRTMLLVDTGGFEDVLASDLAAAVRAQTELAASEADAVVVVFDGREGLNPIDRDLMERVRSLGKPIVYAVNKLDTALREDDATDFFALGLSELVAISAAHGLGVAELMDRVVAQLPDPSAATPNQVLGAVTLAIVGRPNVGKSSLLNRIVGFERAIVDPTPGTTRDALDTPFRHGTQDYILVDTAGIRRRPRVHEQLERASVVRAFGALERAEVALLVIDAIEGMTEQDARIAGYAWERGRAVLLIVNKWDAVPRERRDRRTYRQNLRDSYPTLADVPVVFLSAKTGARIGDLFPVLAELIASHRRELRTVNLNQQLSTLTGALAPPSIQGKRPRFLYATQTGTAPPVVTVFANAPHLVQTAYERYLANGFRRAFELYGTPLRVRFRRAPKREVASFKGQGASRRSRGPRGARRRRV